ncbi:MAG: EAL domain-containing protein, partial [Actinomycetota bacterium]|nr:EAL domain-containing protein [Actinomycetota bacterium]
MYRAKERGRGRYEFFDADTRADAVARLDTELALRSAIEEDGFYVVYQPEVSLATGEAVGVEALARWDHERYGLVGPAEFIPVAEETGLIASIGAFVLEEACRRAGRLGAWRDEPLTMAVNLSRAQLADPHLPRTVRQALAAGGIDPSVLCLEVTETVLLDDPDSAARALEALAALGVSLAIDDFGKGSSSLAYLKRFPVSLL